MATLEERIKAAENLRLALQMYAKTLTDAEASTIPLVYPTLTHSGALIKAGTRINWNGQLKIAAYDTYDRTDTDPDHDKNGWTNLDYHNGYRVIPETMTTTNMFKKDEIGYYTATDKYYKSKIDNNSWNPVAYADGWTEVTI